MQSLSETEIKQAIALISNEPYNVDVIQAVRNLLRKYAEERRLFRLGFKAPPFPYTDGADDMEDTRPFKPIEYDGD